MPHSIHHLFHAIEQRTTSPFRRAVFDFFIFGIKQAYACLFGGVLLMGILATKYFWPPSIGMARYDFLVIYALLIQTSFLLAKLETWEEAKVIFIFHVVGTVMEIFKTHMGSWTYPEANILHIGGVPLFSGFMYSAVGSYIARVWRIFDMRFTPYPRQIWASLLCMAIYINFFTHHFILDLRYVIFAITLVLFWRTRVYFTPHKRTYWMPLLLGWGLVSLFIWIAENVGTISSTWLYPSQKAGWHLVPLPKIGSWYLLMMISFVLVTLIHGDKKADKKEPPHAP